VALEDALVLGVASKEALLLALLSEALEGALLNIGEKLRERARASSSDCLSVDAAREGSRDALEISRREDLLSLSPVLSAGKRTFPLRAEAL
jgi:hypothetical protein